LITAFYLILLSAYVMHLKQSQAFCLKVACFSNALYYCAMWPFLGCFPVLVLDNIVPVTWVSLVVLIFDELLRSLVKDEPRKLVVHWNSEDQRILDFFALGFGFDWLIELGGRVLLDFNEGNHLVAFSIGTVGEANYFG
jgi:hypothetical protein